MTIDYGTKADGTAFARYNGDAQAFFNVKDGSENVIEVSVHQESGTLRITIQQEDNSANVVYDGNTFPSETFTVTAKEPGQYRIGVHAENFVGSYHFQYDMNQ